jgi:hypothetical protein
VTGHGARDGPEESEMKLTIFAVCVSLGVFASAASAQTPAPAAPSTASPADRPTINQRLENQRDRIHAGTKDDQLPAE